MQAAQSDWLERVWPRLISPLKDHDIPLYLIVGNGDVSANYHQHEKLEKAGYCVLLNMRRVSVCPGIDIAGYPFIPFSNSSMKDFEKHDLAHVTPSVADGTDDCSLGFRSA
jgi:hypothetical protein